MANGALSIPISADASKFLQTLATVKSEIKILKKELETATGARIAEINLKITGLEQQKKAFSEFGKYAEGTYGALLQQLDYLNAYKLTLKVGSQELADTVLKLKEVSTLIDTVNGKEIKIKTEVEAPPTGSIKDIENRIKQYKGLRDIEVDSSSLEKFNKIIQRLEERLNRLKTTGIQLPTPEINDEPIANSIEGIRKQIRDLSKQKGRIDLDDQGEIARLNSQIIELEDKLARADKLGFDKKGNISQNAGKARQALTNLKLVAQDLPFGFIAIQNNVPNLLESFSQLQTSGGGLKGAFKELGAQLAGPGGLFLGISLVTTAITLAVQKYGSLGAAVDALFGKIDPLAGAMSRISKELENYNNEAQFVSEIAERGEAAQAGQLQTIQILSSRVRDLSISEKERGRYLDELKRIDKDYFGGLTTGKSDLEKIKIATDNYTESLIINSRVKAFQSQLDEVEKLIASQVALRDEQETSLKAADSIRRSSNKVFVDPTEKVSEQISTTADALKGLYSRRETFVKGLSDALDELGKTIKPPKFEEPPELKDKKIEYKFDLKLSDDYKDFINFNAFDKALDRLKQYGDIVLDVNKTEKERSTALQILNKESKDVLGISTNLFDQFKIGVTPISQISNAIDQYGFSLQDLIIKQKEVLKAAPDSNNYFESLYKSIAKGITGGNIGEFIDTSGLFEQFEKIRMIAKEIPKDVKVSFGEFGNTFPTLDEFKAKLNEIFQLEFLKTGAIDVAAFTKIIKDELDKLNSTVDEFDGLKDLAKEFKTFKDALSDTLLNPLSELFTDVFKDGKEAFAEFGKSVLNTIKQLAAKIIATGIINLLANILLPGSGKAASILGKGTTGAGGGILGAFGAAFKSVFGLKQESNPNFAGVQGGGMQLAGEVVFRQRGSDLVGVINRTNGTISRVG
jgi:hypothetical protein